MRLPSKAAAALAPVMLAACSARGPVVYPAAHAQRLAPDNSMLGEACDGHSPDASLALAGHSYLFVTARISTVVLGDEVPYAAAAAPAAFTESRLAAPRYTGAPGRAPCAGTAMSTLLRRENGRIWLDWSVEIAAPQGLGGDRLPADPWRVSGRLPVDTATGTASGTVAFRAYGRPMIARVTAAPGPEWLSEHRAEILREEEARHPAPPFAAPLPDEKPGRTLSDDASPSAAAKAGR